MVVGEVVAALGADYEAAGLAGARRLGSVRHVPTAYEFLIVPGGSFAMGIREEEEQAILAVLFTLGGFPNAANDERTGWEATLRREVHAIAKTARPVHEVRVPAFLCGRRHMGDVPLHADWRPLCEAEWEYVARASYPSGWLLHEPLAWGNEGAPDRALTQESPLGLFDLVSWDGEGFSEDGWPTAGGYDGAPATAQPFAAEGSELDAIARGGPSYEWASEVAGVWAFFVGARSNAYGQGRRAAITLG